MEKEYDNTNRGRLFKNDRKQQESHSDYNGTINVDGKEYFLDAWVREGKNGKYFSMKVKPKEARRSEAPASADPFGDAPF
jgi:hypothetical protein